LILAVMMNLIIHLILDVMMNLIIHLIFNDIAVVDHSSWCQDLKDLKDLASWCKDVKDLTTRCQFLRTLQLGVKSETLHQRSPDVGSTVSPLNR
jgi:hypothetical protein